MRIRVLGLNIRNPIVGAALFIVAVAFFLAFALLGITLLIGAVAVGAVALVARRVLRRLRRQPPPPEPLDSAQEVFPRDRAAERLPPAGSE
jgi:membrane protein implicated in regulation of membrane protease activity